MVFTHESTLYQATRGIIVHDTDAWGYRGAQVGMVGTTCAVDVEYATLGTDYDYPGSDDTVEDVGEQGGNVVVLVASEDGVHIQKDDGFWGADTDDFPVPDVMEGRLLEDEGVVVLAGDDEDCGVEWVGTTAPGRTDLSPDVCAGSPGLSADPTLGHAFVGHNGGVSLVTPSSSVVVSEDPSELVEWDPVADVLYAAEIGGTTVRGIEADGALRWTTEVGGAVQALDDMGVRASAVVTVAYELGGGGVVVIDGFTGEIDNSFNTPGAADEVKTSNDGRTLALADDEQVHFYGVQSWFESLIHRRRS
ncbi:MAG: hypothetical protein JRI25_19195 [Deltaproteobacteria bacterium]|nr:hypothetical protein [Deltaproteobacteria bacterium]